MAPLDSAAVALRGRSPAVVLLRNDATSFAVGLLLAPMATLSCLDFKPGRAFQDLVYDRFGPFAHVSSPSLLGEFFLVVSFARSALRLDCGSVALILQSVLGGSAEDFRVVFQTSWAFRFSVS